MNHETQQIAEILSVLLLSLGFNAMSRDALINHEKDRQCQYARIILKNLPIDKKRVVQLNFQRLNLV
jgi:hypothetical protein